MKRRFLLLFLITADGGRGVPLRVLLSELLTGFIFEKLLDLTPLLLF